jgi:signal transduction histidine kinase
MSSPPSIQEQAKSSSTQFGADVECLFLDFKGNRRIDKLIDHAWDLRGKDGPTALRILAYAESLLKRSRRSYRKGLAGIWSKRGFLHYVAGQPQLGLEPALSGYEIYLKLGDKGDIAHTCTTIGILYLELGQTEQAHKFLKDAYSLYQETNFQPGIGVSLANMGLLASKGERNREAREYYQRALVVMEQTNNVMGASNMLNNLGAIAFKEERYRESLSWFRRSLRLNRELKNYTYTAIVLANIASAYECIGALERAWKLIHLAEKYYFRGSGSELFADAEIVRIKLLAHQHFIHYNIDEAIYRATSLLETVKGTATLLELMELIPQLHTKGGQLHDAIRHYDAFIRYKKQAAIEEANLRADYAEVVLNIQHSQERERAERRQRLQLAKVNRQLKEINDRKNDFLRMVAHDLKTSAVVIQTLSKMHLNESPDSSTPHFQDDQLTLMASNHMLQLIENLKDIDAIESKMNHRNVAWVEIEPILRQWIRQNRLEAKLKGITIKTAIAADLPAAKTNALCVNRIMENLLSNAIKFSPRNSTVHISSFCKDGVITIEVHDAGPGIPEKERHKLFRKFSRLSTRPTMGEASTGLGLYIAQELSESIGASLSSENHPKGGAVFSLSLPLSQNSAH